MRKKIAVLAGFACLVFGDDYYDIAQGYEKAGDYKRAMEFYKLSASRQNSNDAPLPNLQKEQISTNGAPSQEQNNEGFFESLHIRKHHDMYLLPATYQSNRVASGRNAFETKFQISFAKPLVYDFLGFDEFGFAYTQLSWWQTAKSSAPFRESNYMPEIFVREYVEFWPILKYIQGGFLHHSNGLGGVASRSWNRLYLEGKFGGENFEIIPRIWWKIPQKSDENRDIEDYYGYGDLRMSYMNSGHKISLMLRNNFDFSNNKGAVELSWAFPLFQSGVSGYIGAFSGYGESLIDYNRRIDKIGVGFVITK